MSVRYIPAQDGWVLVAAASSAILCKTDDADVITALWDAIRSGDPVQASLDVLTRKGLTAAPYFAMARWPGTPSSDAVVLARGDASVTVTGADGPVRLDGRSVSTWLEQRVVAPTAIMLGQPAGGAASLPLEAGVVSASSAEFGTSDATAVTPAAAPAAAAPVASAAQPIGEPVAPAPVLTPDPATITSLPESTIAEVPQDQVPAAPASGGYGHLFEETVVRKIEDAAVRPPEELEEHDEPVEPEASALDGDHDGLTVMSGDLAALRKSRRGTTRPTPARETQPILSYFLELSTGGREPLVHTAIVGRSPSVSKVSSGQVPRLIAIPGDQDISRNHAQFALEGGTVVVTDLHSRNGTSVILPGKSPQSLRAEEPTPVIPGTVVDLGGGVRLTVIEEQL